MRVIVTGASGFIGHNVLLRMPRDWDVIAIYHRTAGLDTFVRQHNLGHVRPIHADLCEPRSVQAIARAVEGRADAVLYLAANGDPAVSSDRPRLDLQLNTLSLVTFLEHCAATHFVYVSSGAVYDGAVGPVTPALPVSPRLPYGIAKLAAEHYVRFFAERKKTIGSYINVRFFGAYGPYEPSRKITTRWLESMAAGQREFVIRGDGNNLIDFMYVDDAVDGFLALTKAAGTSATVDFASGSPIPVNEVVAAMARVLKTDVAVRHEGSVPEYIQFRSVDPSMRARFGIEPKVTFDAGLSRLKQFLDANRVPSAARTRG